MSTYIVYDFSWWGTLVNFPCKVWYLIVTTVPETWSSLDSLALNVFSSDQRVNKSIIYHHWFYTGVNISSQPCFIWCSRFRERWLGIKGAELHWQVSLQLCFTLPLHFSSERLTENIFILFINVLFTQQKTAYTALWVNYKYTHPWAVCWTSV